MANGNGNGNGSNGNGVHDHELASAVDALFPGVVALPEMQSQFEPYDLDTAIEMLYPVTVAIAETVKTLDLDSLATLLESTVTRLDDVIVRQNMMLSAQEQMNQVVAELVSVIKQPRERIPVNDDRGRVIRVIDRLAS